MQAIRLAREETSGYLAELLEFAQTRLLEYARLVADRGLEGDNDGLARSCIWELHERGCVFFDGGGGSWAGASVKSISLTLPVCWFAVAHNRTSCYAGAPTPTSIPLLLL